MEAKKIQDLSRAELLKAKMYLEGLLFVKPGDVNIRAQHDLLLEEMKRRKISVID